MRQAKKKKELKKMLDLLSSFCAFWVVNSGIQSGILNLIATANGRITERCLIKESGYAGRFISSWLRAAYATGLLQSDAKEEAYVLTTGLKDILLDQAGPSYLGGSFKMFAELADIFKLHPEAMKSGKKIPLHRQSIPLLRAMADMTRTDFGDLCDFAICADMKFHERLKRGGHILDIGTGLGHGPIHLAKVYPECKITGVDIDKRALTIARANVRQEKLEKRIGLRWADARSLRLKARFDLICMNLSLHEVGADPRERLDFLKRCRRLLKNNGKILIREMAIPDRMIDYKQPYTKVLMGLEMCEAVFGGEMLTSGGLKSLIGKAGFKGLREIDQPERSRIFLLAQK